MDWIASFNGEFLEAFAPIPKHDILLSYERVSNSSFSALISSSPPRPRDMEGCMVSIYCEFRTGLGMVEWWRLASEARPDLGRIRMSRIQL